MGSINNWLAFSLSPQELPPSQPTQAVARLISGDCYGISADDSSLGPPLGIPTLRPPPDGPFGILEALNSTQHQPQEWGMQSLELEFKGNNSSDLSMVVGSSSNQNTMDEDEPKLEDFLGGHDRCSIPGEYAYSDCSPGPAPNGMMMNGGGGGGNMGLSMIKTWLRNQPAPLHQPEIMASSDGDSALVVGGAVPGLGNAQGLSLSMGTGSQSIANASLPLMVTGASGGGESSALDSKQKGSASGLDAQSGAIEAVPRKSIDTFGQRTSIYRGVTRHRWTGRYEAHLWDNSCRREGQTRKGRQVYLGGYDKEDKAARAYDLAALKYWGTTTTTNFPISNYEKELEEMKHMTRQEYVASLRRKSSGFSRGASIYRGVTRHHQHGRWQARIGRVAGNKDLYLGTFSTQEEAAEAYDIAAIKFRGLNAVTNFDMSRYDVKSILESSTLPIGGAAKRLKEASEHAESSIDGRRTEDDGITSQLTDGLSNYAHYHPGWPTLAFQQPQPLSYHYPYGQQRGWCKPEDGMIPVAQSLQDLQQLQLGSSTHNFFQPSVVHNLMSLDSSSVEHSTGSNSIVYNGSMGTSGGGYQAYMGGIGGYAMPVGTVVIDQSHNNQGTSSYGDSEGKQLGYDNMLANVDQYTARNTYFSQQSTESVEQSSACNTWIPASAQATSSRPGNMAGGQGAHIFSVWNDA